MTKTVEFLFDLGSPYSYLAWYQLPKVAEAHGARVVYTPVLLGGIFQATGNASPASVPAKARYLDADLQRWARAWGLQIASNPAFPINTLALMRGAVAMQMQGDEPFQRYMDAMYQAMFGQRTQHGVEEEALLFIGLLAGDEEPEVGREIELADNVSAQVQPAHGDAVGIAGADG